MTEDEYVALFTEENTARIRRQKKTPITVMIGNPPYNVGQVNENDNNKNRKYDAIDAKIRSTYAKSSKATLNTKLSDPYVRFFRWATDRLSGREGLICFVTNKGFIVQVAFDGVTKHLGQEVEAVYLNELK